MREANLYAAIVTGANREGWSLFRISDLAPGRKPFDIAGCAPNGLAVGLEVKVTANQPQPDRTFSRSIFQTHQIEWLESYSEAGALALVTIYSTSDSRLVVYRLCGIQPFSAVCKSFPRVVLSLDTRTSHYLGWRLLL